MWFTCRCAVCVVQTGCRPRLQGARLRGGGGIHPAPALSRAPVHNELRGTAPPQCKEAWCLAAAEASGKCLLGVCVSGCFASPPNTQGPCVPVTTQKARGRGDHTQQGQPTAARHPRPHRPRAASLAFPRAGQGRHAPAPRRRRAAPFSLPPVAPKKATLKGPGGRAQQRPPGRRAGPARAAAHARPRRRRRVGHRGGAGCGAGPHEAAAKEVVVWPLACLGVNRCGCEERVPREASARRVYVGVCRLLCALSSSLSLSVVDVAGCCAVPSCARPSSSARQR